MLTRNQVRDALEQIGNRFFTVTFVTKNGEDRTYNGRINVKKGLKDNERSEIVREAFRTHAIVPIKIDGEQYKAFSMDKVKEIHCGDLQMGEA